MSKPITGKVARGEDKLAAHLRASLPADARSVDVLAFEILALRRDLLPSVERIMNTSGEIETAERALVLFRDSLSVVGDANRDPRVAIANAAKVSTSVDSGS